MSNKPPDRTSFGPVRSITGEIISKPSCFATKLKECPNPDKCKCKDSCKERAKETCAVCESDIIHFQAGGVKYQYCSNWNCDTGLERDDGQTRVGEASAVPDAAFAPPPQPRVKVIPGGSFRGKEDPPERVPGLLGDFKWNQKRQGCPPSELRAGVVPKDRWQHLDRHEKGECDICNAVENGYGDERPFHVEWKGVTRHYCRGCIEREMEIIEGFDIDDVERQKMEEYKKDHPILHLTLLDIDMVDTVGHSIVLEILNSDV